MQKLLSNQIFRKKKHHDGIRRRKETPRLTFGIKMEQN